MKESKAPAVGRTPFQKWLDKYQGILYLIPWIIGFVVFKAFPFGQSLYYSFTDMNFFKSGTTFVGLPVSYTHLLDGVLFHGLDHGLVVLDGGAGLDKVQHAADLFIPHKGALDAGGLGCAHRHEQHIALAQKFFGTGTIQNLSLIHI